MQAKLKEHSPTLDTILMVEETLKNAERSTLRISEIKKILPRQVNHNTLMKILDYLDKSGKICIGVKGVSWWHNDNPKFLEILKTFKDITNETSKRLE